jgi:hypothetical protein
LSTTTCLGGFGVRTEAAEDWGRGTVAVKANLKEKAPVSRPGLATGGEKVAQNTKE